MVKKSEPQSLVNTGAKRMIDFLSASPSRARFFLGFVLVLIAFALYTVIF